MWSVAWNVCVVWGRKSPDFKSGLRKYFCPLKVRCARALFVDSGKKPIYLAGASL